MSIEKIKRTKGSVYKVWYRDDAGRGRSRSFDRRKDAESFEADVRLRKRRGHLEDIDAGRETLATLAEQWWQRYALPHHAPKTLATNRRLLDRYLLPKLGNTQLVKIRPRVVEELADELRQA